MICIFCGGTSRVTNSRLQKKANRVWRRRTCSNCRAIWTSIERLDASNSVLVRDEKNGQIDPFSPDRLFISLFESCRHRPSAISDARALGGTITSQLLAPKNQHQPGVLKLSDLQTTAERVLKHFDRTAYVHYQAYYGSKKPVKNN